MTEDLGTTPRKPLTPTQRLKMFEAHKGLCCLCGLKITTTKWRDEHIRPLAQGGSNEMKNRGPAHIKCADAKTNGKTGDNANTARAKRKKIAAVIGKAEPAKKIESPPFARSGKPKIERNRLEPKILYRNA